MARLHPPRPVTTLGTLLALLVLLLGAAMAQEESAEDDMDMGPYEKFRTVDWEHPHLNVFWSCADLRGVDLSGA